MIFNNYCKRFLLLLLLSLAGHVRGNNSSIDNAPFADELTLKLYDPSQNECTSSLGVSMAMSLVYPSAIDQSKEQMQSVLGYPDNQSILLWENISTNLTDLYQGQCDDPFVNNSGTCFEGAEPTLKIASSIFVDSGLTLNATYAAVVGDLIQKLDFANPNAGSAINDWVNTSTDGLISNIVADGPISAATAVAVNSIYLKAAWMDSFDDTETNEDVFFSNITTAVEAHFMHQVDYFMYSHEALPGYQVLQLAFNDDNLSMVFVLPTTTTSAAATSVDVIKALPNLTRTNVAVALPKFQFESEYKGNLKAALQLLGLMAPFEGNLCIVENQPCNFYIDTIIQKTFIDVDENGVSAAAVTADILAGSIGPVLMPPPPQPVLFEADHPFQFFIYESTENVVLFEGQVVAPGIKKDGSMALLQGVQHTDEDFWSSNFGVTPTVVNKNG